MSEKKLGFEHDEALQRGFGSHEWGFRYRFIRDHIDNRTETGDAVLALADLMRQHLAKHPDEKYEKSSPELLGLIAQIRSLVGLL